MVRWEVLCVQREALIYHPPLTTIASVVDLSVWPRKLDMVTPVNSAAHSRTVGMEHGEEIWHDHGIDRMASDGK